MYKTEVKQIFRLYVGIIIIIFVIQVISFDGPLVGNTSAGSSWIQATQADFLAGTGENVTITPDGNVTLELETKLIEDDFFDESMISSKRRTIVDTDYGELRLNKFSKLFGGGSVDQGFWVNQTMDGGYIIAGYTNSYGAGDFDAWLIKTDASGNKIWDRLYGGSSNDFTRMALPTSDGGYIMVGDTQSFGGSDQDVWLIKTNETGIEQWNKTFGGSSQDVGSSIQITNDNGYIISGYTHSYGPGNADFWLIKTNETGVEQWNNTFGATGSQDQCNFAQQTSDGGYIMTGHTFMISGLGGQDGWLVKTNEMGVHQWNQFIGNNKDDQCFMVKQTSDGGYILAGDTKSYGQNQNGDALLVKTNSNGVQQWYKNYGGYWSDSIYSVTIKSDGGYILGGGTLSYGAGGGDAWIIETDSSGNGLWYKLCGGTNDDYVRSLQQIEDGTIVMVGYTLSFGAGNYDLWFFKTNSLGNDTWGKTFGGSSSDVGRSVLQTSDGGHIITGCTISYGTGGSTDVWLIKTDQNGTEEWNRTYGGGQGDLGWSVQQTPDSGFIIAGNTSSYGVGNSSVWLIKTDNNGIEIWNRTFGGSDFDLGYSLDQTNDEGYIITGYTKSYGAGGEDVWLIKINVTGVEQWNRTYGGSSDDRGHSIAMARDGGYIITGYTKSSGAGGEDGWLIKTNATGVKQWDKTFGSTADERANDVQQTSDGGYIITGSTGIPNNGIWLFKTNSTGSQEWAREFDRANSGWSDLGQSVQQTPDGGYIIAGFSLSYTLSYWEGCLLKTNSSGIEQWYKMFASTNNDYLWSVELTQEGGYIAAGQSSSFGAGGWDAWLIKDDTSWGDATLVILLEDDSAYLFNNFTCSVVQPPETGLRIQFSLDNQSWFNSTGSIRGWDILSDGSNLINLSSLGWNGSKFYYRVNFHSDGWETAALTSINFSYQRYTPSGTLESLSYDSGGEPSWRTLNWNATAPQDTEIKFQLRSAATQGGLSSKNFVGPDGTPDTNYTISDADIWPGHNGEQWIQYKVYLNTTNGSNAPILYNVTLLFNLVPAPPLLTDPTNNLLTNNNTLSFNWTFIDSDSTQAVFQVVIDDDIGFGSVDYDSGQQSSSNPYWQFPTGTGYTIIADGTWYWKVRTNDSDGDWSQYSNVWNITVDATPPNAFTPTANPSTWTNNTQPQITFSTTDAFSGMDHFEVKIDSGGFTSQTSPYTLPP